MNPNIILLHIIPGNKSLTCVYNYLCTLSLHINNNNPRPYARTTNHKFLLSYQFSDEWTIEGLLYLDTNKYLKIKYLIKIPRKANKITQGCKGKKNAANIK